MVGVFVRLHYIYLYGFHAKTIKKEGNILYFCVVGYFTMVIDVNFMSTYIDVFDLGSDTQVEELET